MGHPVLARRADPVPDPTAPAIRRLVADMLETMIDADGAGLAAPQVHVPLRVVVFQAPGERTQEGLAQAEIARRLGVNRSTINRYAPDLPGHIYIENDGR